MGTVPPPPRSPVLHSASPQERRRFPIQPPALSTTSLPVQRYAHFNTPASAVSGSLPFSPAVSSAASLHPPRDPASMASRSAAMAYNPSEWGRNAPAGMNYVPHAASSARRRAQGTQNHTGMEAAMPSPPPPYSASPAAATAAASARPLRTSPHLGAFPPAAASPAGTSSEYNTPISAATSASASSFSAIPRPGQTPSQHTSPTAFLPPPPPSTQRDRSSSRPRFNLSGLASRVLGAENTMSSNAMETLHQQTVEALARAPAAPPSSFPLSVNPPGARRAASAGAMRPATATPPQDYSQARSINESGQISYGLAIPGPPPGPPPGVRSQSLNRAADREPGHQSANAPFPLRAQMRPSQLGPVPPTPADWVDEDTHATANSSDASTHPSTGQDSSVDGRRSPPLFNAVSRELTSSRSIRERRSESRARARDASREPLTAIEQTTNPWAADLDLSRTANLHMTNKSALGRRRHVSKSKTSPLFSSPESPFFQRHTRVVSSSHSDALASATPLPDSAKIGPTPPHSAASAITTAPIGSARHEKRPKDLPTPETGDDFEYNGAASGRPQLSAQLSAASLDFPSENFANSSMERFKAFLRAESAATDDNARLELFASFIVMESRLRRDKYAEAFESLGGDVLELTRDLWRPMHNRRAKTPTPASAGLNIKVSSAQPPRLDSAAIDSASTGSAAPSIAGTPRTAQESPTSSMSQSRDRSNSQRNHSYKPALSPILSMAQSTTADDDEGSRGRAPSRWWEASNDGGSIGGTRKVERSKRESKYMGVAREALQRDFDSESPAYNGSFAGPSEMYQTLGVNEYPPEKTGWHDADMVTPMHSPQPTRTPTAKSTPKVDVSRLITLPPPYPRHHPALNNSHPELAGIRQNLRSVTDRTFITEVQEAFKVSCEERARTDGPAEDRKRQMRQQIHEQVSQGLISFAEAAKREASFGEQEALHKKEVAQKTFDEFQMKVMGPLSASISERISGASASIDQLRESLSDEARSRDPSLTQEEGDEKPELLEKLTLLKWLFEAREQLHRDTFLLESQSDEMYKRIILIPYETSGTKEKIAEVEEFFEKDKCTRRAVQEKKSLKRFENFLAIVEQHVTRGVELQLSAFWDIAPGLLAVLQQVPYTLTAFEIFIPADEYEENPVYHEHPMQYLYSLLSHAEKSAYQFIESQTNLLCLLHEVKTGVMQAGCKLIETQREQAGEDPTTLALEMEGVRRDEDTRLTCDLKEKVDIADKQWKEALGKRVGECKLRVKAFLVQKHGWADELDE